MQRLTVKIVPFLFLLSSCCRAQSLPSWQPGTLDLHHISTGSGNAAFLIFPDGTTLLFDAGDLDREARLKYPNPLKVSPRLPHDSLSAARAIVNYIRQVLPAITNIDYAVISHFHTDHFGSAGPHSSMSANGNYRLSGITEVNELIPIHKLIDRDYPAYRYPLNLEKYVQDKASFVNYLEFLRSQTARQRLQAEALIAGSKSQITPVVNPGQYADFTVRNIKSNGNIWSGTENGVIRIFPDSIPALSYNENTLSLALKISYGKFDYFTGGDMTGLQGFGLPAWFDTETPVAAVVGKVEALSLNHHGVRDATNELFLKTLEPQVIIQQSWSSNHPGEEVLHRMISQDVYPGKRDIFATYIHEETTATYGRWLNENYKAKHGHLLIRVLPTGNKFFVYVLDDTALQLKVLKTFGPYESH